MGEAFPFGQWLKRRRRTLDLTQAELAQRASCAAVTIKKIEAGDLLASQQLAQLLAQVLGVPPAQVAAFVAFARTPTATARADGFSAIAPQATPPTPIRNYRLPTALTPLIGRDNEFGAISALLQASDTRLVSLIGPPGAGKTRLSLAIATSLQFRYADAAAFVPLAPISDPALLLPTISQALGLREAADTPPLAALADWLNQRELLLVLDNFEQVLAAAPLVSELLAAAPRLRVLATSRERLHLYGEHEFYLPPLAPDEAVELFVQRARLSHAGFQLTQERRAAIELLCAGLDRLPLALELAAARVRSQPVEGLLAQLSQRLTLLSDGPRDRSPRQQTLRGAISWSYDILSPVEQQVFRQLGVFVGGATVPAASAVVLAEDGHLPALLESLADKSLLQREISTTAELRYTMLETLREYAIEKLEQHGEDTAARQRQAAYFYELAQAAVPQLLGEHQLEWLARLDREHTNLRAVLAYCLAAPGAAVPDALALVDALFIFWHHRNHYSEARRWFAAALASDETPSVLRARVLNRAGTFAWRQAEYDTASQLQQQALAMQEHLADNAGISRSLQNLAIIAGIRGEYTQAAELLGRALVIERQSNNTQALATILNNLALVAQRQADYARAEALLSESLLLRAELSDRIGLAHAVQTLGIVTAQLGKVRQAAAVFRRGLALYTELGDQLGAAQALERLAATMVEASPRQAASLLGKAAALRQAIGTPLAPDDHSQYYDACVEQLQQRLAVAEYQAAWAAGARLSLAEAGAL